MIILGLSDASAMIDDDRYFWLLTTERIQQLNGDRQSIAGHQTNPKE